MWGLLNVSELLHILCGKHYQNKKRFSQCYQFITKEQLMILRNEESTFLSKCKQTSAFECTGKQNNTY